jgi:HlyD family secretion protein
MAPLIILKGIRKSMKRNAVVKYSILSAIALTLVLIGYFLVKRNAKDPKEKYLTVKAERGNLRRNVSSTGTLQAVVTVQVGSQVSGRIQELHADFNSVVKKGQTLAVIDPANFEAQRDRAQAQLATAYATVKNAEATLVNRQAELNSAKANLEVARVAMKDAERQHSRAQGLFKDGLISERDLDTARVAAEQNVARFHQAEAQVNQTEAAIRSARSQQEQADANVMQAKAELQMSQVNLRYTNIISPIDGVVIERNVDIGQTVAASLQAPILFVIANDLTRMQVIAQIDEADIGVLSEKAKVDFSVDAFPSQAFRGKIAEIRLTSKLPNSSSSSSSSSGTSSSGGGGGTASNVVVYNVMIDVENPQLKLRPGMTANVNFTVSNSDNVLKVANAALRYRPSDKNPEEIQKLMSSLYGEASADTRPRDFSSAGSGGQREGSSGSGDIAVGANAQERPGKRGRPDTDGTDPRVSDPSERRSRGGWAGRSGGAQAVIGPSTTDVYGIRAGLKVRFPQAEEARPIPGMIWVLDADGKPQPRRVTLGITDGRETAVLDGELRESDVVITGELSDEANAAAARGNSATPFRGVGPQGGGGRRGGR